MSCWSRAAAEKKGVRFEPTFDANPLAWFEQLLDKIGQKDERREFRRSMGPPGLQRSTSVLERSGLNKSAFGSKALAEVRAHRGQALDFILIGDIGYTQDDEKALAMIVALQRSGIIANFTVVVNTSSGLQRAKLAKGTLNTLGAGDVRVGVGNAATQLAEQLHFEECDYLADASEIYQGARPCPTRPACPRAPRTRVRPTCAPPAPPHCTAPATTSHDPSSCLLAQAAR